MPPISYPPSLSLGKEELHLGEALMSGGAGGSGTIYKWKRYELNSSTRYTWNKWSLNSTTTYRWNKYSISQSAYSESSRSVSTTFDSHVGSWGTLYSLWYPCVHKEYIKITNSLTTGSVYAYIMDTESGVGYFGSDINSRLPYTFNSGYAMSASSNVSNGGGHDKYTSYWDNITVTSITQIRRDDSDTIFRTAINATLHTISTPGSQSRGTYIGEVTSSSSSAYPSNGISGSYWYTSIGSNVSYSKGSTSYGKVESDNSSAYPDGSWQDGYWYDGRSGGTTYSQGAAAGTVYNTNRNAYPDNSYTGSYWYVFDGEA